MAGQQRASRVLTRKKIPSISSYAYGVRDVRARWKNIAAPRRELGGGEGGGGSLRFLNVTPPVAQPRDGRHQTPRPRSLLGTQVRSQAGRAMGTRSRVLAMRLRGGWTDGGFDERETTDLHD